MLQVAAAATDYRLTRIVFIIICSDELEYRLRQSQMSAKLECSHYEAD